MIYTLTAALFTLVVGEKINVSITRQKYFDIIELSAEQKEEEREHICTNFRGRIHQRFCICPSSRPNFYSNDDESIAACHGATENECNISKEVPVMSMRNYVATFKTHTTFCKKSPIVASSPSQWVGTQWADMNEVTKLIEVTNDFSGKKLVMKMNGNQAIRNTMQGALIRMTVSCDDNYKNNSNVKSRNPKNAPTDKVDGNLQTSCLIFKIEETTQFEVPTDRRKNPRASSETTQFNVVVRFENKSDKAGGGLTAATVIIFVIISIVLLIFIYFYYHFSKFKSKMESILKNFNQRHDALAQMLSFDTPPRKSSVPKKITTCNDVYWSEKEQNNNRRSVPFQGESNNINNISTHQDFSSINGITPNNNSEDNDYNDRQHYNSNNHQHNNSNDQQHPKNNDHYDNNKHIIEDSNVIQQKDGDTTPKTYQRVSYNGVPMPSSLPPIFNPHTNNTVIPSTEEHSVKIHAGTS